MLALRSLTMPALSLALLAHVLLYCALLRDPQVQLVLLIIVPGPVCIVLFYIFWVLMLIVVGRPFFRRRSTFYLRTIVRGIASMPVFGPALHQALVILERLLVVPIEVYNLHW